MEVMYRGKIYDLETHDDNVIISKEKVKFVAAEDWFNKDGVNIDDLTEGEKMAALMLIGLSMGETVSGYYKKSRLEIITEYQEVETMDLDQFVEKLFLGEMVIIPKHPLENVTIADKIQEHYSYLISDKREVM